MTDKEPPTIELSERERTRTYVLKPMSRWYFFFFVGFGIFAAYMNGFDKITTWGLLFFGGAIAASAVLVWPYIHLKKIDD